LTPPTWFREFNAAGWPLCPVCRQDTLVSLALVSLHGVAVEPTLAQGLLGPVKCQNCGWRKAQTEIAP
jgi:hypothetical protein